MSLTADESTWVMRADTGPGIYRWCPKCVKFTRTWQEAGVHQGEHCTECEPPEVVGWY